MCLLVTVIHEVIKNVAGRQTALLPPSPISVESPKIRIPVQCTGWCDGNTSHCKSSFCEDVIPGIPVSGNRTMINPLPPAASLEEKWQFYVHSIPDGCLFAFRIIAKTAPSSSLTRMITPLALHDDDNDNDIVIVTVTVFVFLETLVSRAKC